MNPRKDLRHSTVEALRQADLVRMGCIHDSRKLPTERDELPAISVFTRSSSAAGQNPFMTDLDFPTTITLSIEVGMDGDEDDYLMAALDDLCEDILDTLLCNPVWLLPLQGIGSIVIDFKPNDASDRRTNTAQIDIDCVVSTLYKPRIKDELRTVDIEVDEIGPAADPNVKYPGPDGRIEAHMQLNQLTD